MRSRDRTPPQLPPFRRSLPSESTVDDSVGSFRVFTGAQADEAMELFLPRFIEDEDASANGVLFADERGFIDGWSVVALGDSDRVFAFDAPDNLDVADLPAAMQKVADLLLVR